MERLLIIIPALNPLPSLLLFLEKLSRLSSTVIVINDGSDDKYNYIFNKIRLLEHCVVLEHHENRGKGAALKTGFAYVLQHEKKVKYVLTAGAHGQHTIEDITHMIESAKVFSDGIMLGVRRFRSADMPTFSFLGNRAVSVLFEILFRKRLLDIQSGLRVIPKQELFWLVKVQGETFNYDVNMLVEAIRRKIPIYEIPIGYARLRKNSVMHYDEIINMRDNLQQIWSSFKGKKVK